MLLILPVKRVFPLITRKEQMVGHLNHDSVDVWMGRCLRFQTSFFFSFFFFFFFFFFALKKVWVCMCGWVGVGGGGGDFERPLQ